MLSIVVVRRTTRRRTTIPFLPSALVTSRRFLDYWAFGVTGRTQYFAQGDMLPRLDNTRKAINKSTAAAATLTGNPSGIAYDSTNIFSAIGYSQLEKEHYQPLRGISTHKMDTTLREKEGHTVAALMRELKAASGIESLEYLWWDRLLKDFPSLAKPCTPDFKTSWEEFYLKASEVVYDNAAVNLLAVPFVRKQMQVNYISYPLIWRIAERLGNALESSPIASRYEKRISVRVVEHITKLMLDTIANEPWAHQDTTSPLHVDVTSLRAWHEAGFW
ncbi:unnamed protein product [Phytomonas sp. Hart1]|nr:unnamed protein product [Phytomonas sp. Hart1]|eukprot:CCW67430.1 unnamed protein product [Phytomonas sp. isolate Hart1]